MSITNDIIIGSNAAIQFSDGTTLVSSDFAGPSSSVLTPADADINADYASATDTTGSGGDGVGDINFKINGVTKASILNNGNAEFGADASVAGALDVTGTATVGEATNGNHVVSFNDIYPVGSIYMNATVSTNPGTLLGVGTWVEMGEGKVLLGESSSYAAEATGGATTETLDLTELTNHTHTTDLQHDHSGSSGSATGSGGHQHTLPLGGNAGVQGGAGSGDANWNQGASTASGEGTHDHTVSVTIENDLSTTEVSGGAGNGQSFNIMQPYLVVYMWYRTQ
jgi:hypothetical protein